MAGLERVRFNLPDIVEPSLFSAETCREQGLGGKEQQPEFFRLADQHGHDSERGCGFRWDSVNRLVAGTGLCPADALFRMQQLQRNVDAELECRAR